MIEHQQGLLRYFGKIQALSMVRKFCVETEKQLGEAPLLHKISVGQLHVRQSKIAGSFSRSRKQFLLLVHEAGWFYHPRRSGYGVLFGRILMSRIRTIG